MNPILASILGLIVFAIVLSVIVLLHEGGHFLVAKKSGILCHEYSIGMGPKIYSKKIGETVYSIRAIPLGGYVAMAGEEADSDILKGVKKVKVELDDNGRVKTIIVNCENPTYKDLPVYSIVSYDLLGTEQALDDELYMILKGEDGEVTFTVNRDAMVNVVKKEEIQIAPYNRRFSNKPYWPRFLSVFAGPLMNFVFAVVIFFLMGLIFGYADTSSTTVAEVSSASALAGLKDHDTIHEIAGQSVSNWDDITTVLNSCAEGNLLSDTGEVTVKYTAFEDNTLKTITFKPVIYIISAQFFVEGSAEGVFIANDTFSRDWLAETGLDKLGVAYGDKIVKIDGFTMSNVNDVLKYYSSQIGTSLKTKVTVLHEGSENEVELSVYSKEMLATQGLTATKVQLGISTASKFNFVKLLYMPWVNTFNASTQVFSTLKLLFSRNSGVSITDLSGPVGIYNLFTRLVSGDDAFLNILNWTGLLSVNIGLVNLLPLPALDGGRLAFLIYEGITKKKPSPKVENTIHNIGFILLMLLFVVIFISDIIKCF